MNRVTRPVCVFGLLCVLGLAAGLTAECEAATGVVASNAPAMDLPLMRHAGVSLAGPILSTPLAVTLLLLTFLAFIVVPGYIFHTLILRDFLDRTLLTDRPHLVLIRDLAFSLLFGTVLLSVAALGVLTFVAVPLDRRVVAITASAVLAGTVAVAILRLRSQTFAILFGNRLRFWRGKLPIVALTLLLLSGAAVLQFFLIRFADVYQHPDVFDPCRHEVAFMMSHADRTEGVTFYNPVDAKADTFFLPTLEGHIAFMREAMGAQRLLVLTNIAAFLALWGQWGGFIFVTVVWTFILFSFMYLLAAAATTRIPLAAAVAAVTWHAANQMLMYMTNENVTVAACVGAMALVAFALYRVGPSTADDAQELEVGAGIWLCLGLLLGAAYGYRYEAMLFAPALLYLARQGRFMPAEFRLRSLGSFKSRSFTVFKTLTRRRVLLRGFLYAAAFSLLLNFLRIGRLDFFHPRISFGIVPNKLFGFIPFSFWPLNFPLHDHLIRFVYNQFPSYLMTCLYFIWSMGGVFLALACAGWWLTRRQRRPVAVFLAIFLGVFILFFFLIEHISPHQYTYLAHVFALFAYPVALAVDGLLRRLTWSYVARVAVLSFAVLALFVTVVPHANVAADERRTPIFRAWKWDPRWLLFQFPFSPRAALPPAPRWYPNQNLLAYLPYVFADGELQGYSAESNHTFFYSPMVLRSTEVFSRRVALAPAGASAIRDAVIRSQAETFTVLVELDLEQGAALDTSIRLDPEKIELRAEQTGDLPEPQLIIRLLRPAPLHPTAPRKKQIYAFDIVGGTYVARDRIHVFVDGKEDPAFKFVGHGSGGWLTNLSQATFPVVELGLQVRVERAGDLDGLSLHVFDENRPMVSPNARSTDLGLWTATGQLENTTYRLTWPEMALDEWAIVSTIHPTVNPPSMRYLYAGPLRALQRTEAGWPAVKVADKPSVPAFANHPVFFTMDGTRPLPVVPLR